MIKRSALPFLAVLALSTAISTLHAQQGQAGAPGPAGPAQVGPGPGGPGPGGPGPGGPGPGGPGRGRGMGRVSQARWIFSETNPDKPPLTADATEERVMKVIADLAEKDTSNLLVPLEDGRLIRMLAESTGAKNIVEIGTYNGYSALWFSMALRKTGGKITTHEIDANNVAMARENLSKAGVEDLVTIVQGDAHETVTRLKDPIDILFIDADKPGYADYLKKLMPLVRPGGLILAHNTTNTARQMPDYFTAVTTDPNLDTIFLGQQSVGIGVTLKKRR